MNTTETTEVYEIIKKIGKVTVAKIAFEMLRYIHERDKGIFGMPQNEPPTPESLIKTWISSKPPHMTMEQHIENVMDNWYRFIHSELYKETIKM